MIKLDMRSNEPVYQQIVSRLKYLILASKIHAHEKLLSVRNLARELEVNPNTVQKSYMILESEGLIYSIVGKGDYVADNSDAIREMKRRQIVDAFKKATLDARDSGMWIDEIIRVVDEAYSS